MSRFITKGKFKEINGTILQPENAGLRIVFSVAAMNGDTSHKAFDLFNKKWPTLKQDVKFWHINKNGFSYKLGELLTTAVQSDVWVLSVLCLDDNLSLDETALRSGLKKIVEKTKYEKATIHISSLFLESYPVLKSLLTEEVINQGLHVYTYNEPSLKK